MFENPFYNYFFLTALNILLPHLLQLTLPCIIFMFGALIFCLHFLQTKTFLNFLISASGNLTIIQHLLPALLLARPL